MNPMEVEIFHVTFLGRDCYISTENYSSRTKKFVEDFKCLVPRLQRLTTSKITTRMQHEASGLILTILLRDRMQPNLFWGRPHVQLALETSEFEQEVNEVQQDIETLKTRIEAAMGAGVTAARLRWNDTHAQQYRSIRELVLKRRGGHILSDHTQSLQYSSAKIFAQGHLASVSAKIVNLNPGFARLKEVSFIGEIPVDLQGAKFDSSTAMRRPKSGNSDVVATKLLQALDSGKHIEMEVLIHWDATTGNPHSTDFKSFIPVETSSSVEPTNPRSN
jgi:hypothetical protein